jgi:hypothetical protein
VVQATEAEIEIVLRLLTETPGRIATVTWNMNADQLHQKADAKSWSASEILAHLRACADVWGETMEAMLREDEPAVKHVSPRTYMKKTEYPRLPFQESFQSFVDQRRALLHALHDLTLAEWSRGAMIKNRRHTVFSQARRMALHEVAHSDQLDLLAAAV